MNDANTATTVRNERDAAHQNINQAAQQTAAGAERALDKAGPAVDKAVQRSGELAHAAVDRVADTAERGATWVRANGDRVRERVEVARDRTAERVRQDPIKAVLMAAAAGAVVYAVMHAFSGNNR